jgi:hypothetical protein
VLKWISKLSPFHLDHFTRHPDPATQEKDHSSLLRINSAQRPYLAWKKMRGFIASLRMTSVVRPRSQDAIMARLDGKMKR